MTDTKFTPGPWRAEHDCGPENPHAVASTGVWSEPLYEEALTSTDCEDDARDDAWVCGIWGSIGETEIANAYLIAAAPEIHDALVGLKKEVSGWLGAFEGELREIGGNTNFHCMWRKIEQANEALAKARGEQS